MTDALKRLAEFQQLVLADPALQRELREAADLPVFLERVLALGALHGYDFTAEDIQAGLRAGRRAWLEKWILP
jgi:hypothetical protein